MSHRTLLLPGLLASAALPVQAEVILHIDDVQADWRSDLIDAGYVPTAGDRFTLSIGGNSLHGGSDTVLTPVPLPPALWLLAADLGGMACFRRRGSCVPATPV
jgi:hypothetical protein